MKNNPRNKVRVTQDTLQISDLKLADYQRVPTLTAIQDKAKNFNKLLIGTITVSKRDGQFYVVDGQHRVMICRMKEIKTINALIYDGLTYQEEAELFYLLNTTSKPLRPFEKFNARVESGDMTAITVKGIVESLGIKISAANGPNTLTAIGTALDVYEKEGAYHLQKTLELARDTWAGQTYAFNNGNLRGVSAFIKIYAGELDEGTFKKQLSKVTAKQITAEAKTDFSTDRKVIKTMNVLFKYYNKGLRVKKLENKHFNF